jgi:microsomal epoxide hydrolase
VNMCLMTDEKKMDMSALTESEKAGIERWKNWRATGMAYAIEQATKPATLGFVLTSNPLATLAWYI